MAWEIIYQMLRNSDRPYPGATPSMWNTEGLVQIKVTDIRTDPAGAT